MQYLSVYFQMVEACISSLGLDPSTLRGAKEGQWNLQKGSAPVWVDVFYDEHNQCSYIQMLSPIVEVPANNTIAFYEEVLKKGHDLFGVGFTQFDKWVYIKSIRECENLQQAEVMAMLNRVGVYADEYDDYFKNKYAVSSFRRSDN
jgi:hypothetical protein